MIQDFYERIRMAGIIPVVRIDSVERAVPLADALMRGGICVIEITFRTACAVEAIRCIRRECPEMLVGAGTVLSVAQADEAMDAGAAFLVSPGLNPDVVRHSLGRGVPILPGCLTPTEIEQAMALGIDVVKFFPVEQFGGLATIRALAAPYAGIRFMPTGGVTSDNLGAYLAFDRVLACGGSFMICDDLDEVTRRSATAVAIVRKHRS